MTVLTSIAVHWPSRGSCPTPTSHTEEHNASYNMDHSPVNREIEGNGVFSILHPSLCVSLESYIMPYSVLVFCLASERRQLGTSHLYWWRFSINFASIAGEHWSSIFLATICHFMYLKPQYRVINDQKSDYQFIYKIQNSPSFGPMFAWWKRRYTQGRQCTAKKST